MPRLRVQQAPPKWQPPPKPVRKPSHDPLRKQAPEKDPPPKWNPPKDPPPKKKD